MEVPGMCPRLKWNISISSIHWLMLKGPDFAAVHCIVCTNMPHLPDTPTPSSAHPSHCWCSLGHSLELRKRFVVFVDGLKIMWGHCGIGALGHSLMYVHSPLYLQSWCRRPSTRMWGWPGQDNTSHIEQVSSLSTQNLGVEGHDWQVRLMRVCILQYNSYSWTNNLD